MWQALWANRPAVKEGAMAVAPGPGSGLLLDETIVQRYRIG